MFAFIPKYKNLSEVLMDQKLAKLGDAYVNFLYSIVLSKKNGEPTGTKVKGRLLADAFKKAGLSMKKLICPLSEAFLYCSPETPEKCLYRVLACAQSPKSRVKKILLKEWKRHVPGK